MARSYRDVETALIPADPRLKEAAETALAILDREGVIVPSTNEGSTRIWKFEVQGAESTRFTISCAGPSLPSRVPDEVIRPEDIAKERPFIGTWRLMVKAPILVLDLYWQDGKPLRIMTFANGDWQNELSQIGWNAEVMSNRTGNR